MTNLDSLKRRLARLRAEGPGDPSESEAEPSDDDDTADVPVSITGSYLKPKVRKTTT
jgi:hypothetical protein